MNGFLNLYKPSGMSSAYALNIIKKQFRGVKIGHMGTLDPLASGVLPVAFSKSTRLFDFLLDKDKTYVAEFTFGYETDTLDRGGKVISETNVIPTKQEIESVLSSLVGEVEQMPPAYSAKNVNGKRSYELARLGIAVELKPKKVMISAIELVEQKTNNCFVFNIKCKGGTYIRSICRDMAYKLNTLATMTALERTKSGVFCKENAFTLDEIVGGFNEEKMIISPDKVVDFPIINLDKKLTTELLNGRDFLLEKVDGTYKVFGENQFIGVGILNDKKLKIKAFIKD